MYVGVGWVGREGKSVCAMVGAHAFVCHALPSANRALPGGNLTGTAPFDVWGCSPGITHARVRGCMQGDEDDEDEDDEVR